MGPVEIRRQAVAGEPPHEVGEVAVRVAGDVEADGVGELPLFDFAEGADVEPLVEGGEEGGVYEGDEVRVDDGGRGDVRGCEQDGGEELVKELLVVCAAEGGGAVFGGVARVYDERGVVGRCVGHELRGPEGGAALQERVALMGEPGGVVGVGPFVVDVLVRVRWLF